MTLGLDAAEAVTVIVIDCVTVGHLDHADWLDDARAVDVFTQPSTYLVRFGLPHTDSQVQVGSKLVAVPPTGQISAGLLPSYSLSTPSKPSGRKRPERSRGTLGTIAIHWIRQSLP